MINLARRLKRLFLVFSEDRKGRLYYYDLYSGESSWEHPNDPFYRSLVRRYRLAGGDNTIATSTAIQTKDTMSNMHLFEGEHEDGNVRNDVVGDHLANNRPAPPPNNQRVNHLPKGRPSGEVKKGRRNTCCVELGCFGILAKR